MAVDPGSSPHPPRKPAATPLAQPAGGDTIDVDPAAAAQAVAAGRAPSRDGNAIYLDTPSSAPQQSTPAPKERPRSATAGHPAAEPAEPAAAAGPGPGGIQQCGEYELIEEIGRGGMGRVYLARSQKLDRLVALKMLLAGPGAGLEQIRRLMVEAKTMAALEHPNVVRVFDVGVEGDIHYFTMEFIDGPSLSQVMHTLKTGAKSSSSLPDLIENLRKRKGSSVSALDARAHGSRTPGSRPASAASAAGNAPGRASALGAGADEAPPATGELRRSPQSAPGSASGALPPDSAGASGPASSHRSAGSRREVGDRSGHSPMPAFQAAVLIEKCARALAHAHARGIIHRDLKPGNILMRAADNPVVLDFGLARQVNLDEDSDSPDGPARLTMMGQVLGTPAYMSPEQGRGEIDLVDEQSDTYSLGAILYEMLTGREPLTPSRTIGEALRKIQEEEPVPPSRLVKRIPADLETITLKALQKDRTQRYANAEAFAEDLRRLREGEPILARPQGWLYRTYKFVEKHRVPLTAAGVVTLFFLILLGTVVWQAYRQEVESSRTILQQLADLKKERADKERSEAEKKQAENELENLLGQLTVHEFSTDFSLPIDLDNDQSPFRTAAWPPKTPGAPAPSAGYWRVLRGRLNGRSGIKHSRGDSDNGLLLYNRPLIGDVAVDYEIETLPMGPEYPAEIAFVLNARADSNTDSGYFVSIKREGVRVRRLGAEVHGSSGYADLQPGRRYHVHIEKASDRLTAAIKPAGPQDPPAEWTTVLDFRDPDPVSGEALNRFGWYTYRSEVQIFNFKVTRPVPARPRPIHFAHKLFNRGEYEMARAEYQEVSRIGFGARVTQDNTAALHWIQADGVEADYRVALCSERLADRETDPRRAAEFLGKAEEGYKTFLYEHAATTAVAGRAEEYPELHALALAHLAICYLKRAWKPQAAEIVQQLDAFTTAPGPDRARRETAADTGWSVLAEYALYESVRVPLPAAVLDRPAYEARVMSYIVTAAEFARRIHTPRLAEEKAKSLLQSLRMSYHLDRNSAAYIANIGQVYETLGGGSFTAPDLFLSQLAFHDDDLNGALYTTLMQLARDRRAPAADLEAFRVVRLCNQDSVGNAEKLAALERVFAMPGGDLQSLLRCGEKAGEYQNFELAHKFFERALRFSGADPHRMVLIYRGLGCAMYDIGENAVDPAQRVRGIADLLAAADYAGAPNVLDEEAVRLERFLEDHPDEHHLLKEYLQNTAAPSLALRRWGLFCLCAGRFDEARKVLQASFAEEPQNPFTLYLLAVAASHTNEPQTAAGFLEDASERWPTTSVLDGLAALHLATDDFQAAWQDCERANNLRPLNETANGRRAFALARLDRWPEALSAAQLTLDLDRTNRPALVVAMADALLRKDLQAARQWEQALHDLPDFSGVQLASKIRQNTEIKLPREIGFANVAMGNLEDYLPLTTPKPVATPQAPPVPATPPTPGPQAAPAPPPRSPQRKPDPEGGL